MKKSEENSYRERDFHSPHPVSFSRLLRHAENTVALFFVICPSGTPPKLGEAAKVHRMKKFNQLAKKKKKKKKLLKTLLSSIKKAWGFTAEKWDTGLDAKGLATWECRG